MGGGGFSTDGVRSPLDEQFLALARERRGVDRPRVCFVRHGQRRQPGLPAGASTQAFDAGRRDQPPDPVRPGGRGHPGLRRRRRTRSTSGGGNTAQPARGLACPRRSTSRSARRHDAGHRPGRRCRPGRSAGSRAGRPTRSARRCSRSTARSGSSPAATPRTTTASPNVDRPTTRSSAAAGCRPGWRSTTTPRRCSTARTLVEVVASHAGPTAYRVSPDGRGGVTETPLPARTLP